WPNLSAEARPRCPASSGERRRDGAPPPCSALCSQLVPSAHQSAEYQEAWVRSAPIWWNDAAKLPSLDASRTCGQRNFTPVRRLDRCRTNQLPRTPVCAESRTLPPLPRSARQTRDRRRPLLGLMADAAWKRLLQP